MVFTVVIPIFKFGRGGSYNRISELIEFFLNRRLKVFLVTIQGETSIPSFSSPNYHLIAMKKYKNNVLAFFIFSIFIQFKMLKVLLKEENAVILTFGGINSFYMIFSSFISRKKLITFVRGDEILEIQIKYKQPILRIYQFLYRLGILRTNKILSVNSDLVRKLIREYQISPERFLVIPNSISPSIIKDISKDNLNNSNLTIGYAGSFRINKGVGTLLKALKSLLERDYNIDAFLVGNGPEEMQMRFFIMKNNFEKNIHILSWKESLDNFFEKIDLLISPSLYEGCPNIVLESIARGIPVLGTSVGGTKEILLYTELLFDPNNYLELAKKIETVYNNKSILSLYKEMVKDRRKDFLVDWKKKTLLTLIGIINS